MYCERCGKEYNEDEDRDIFESDYCTFNYDNFTGNFCFGCKSEIIENREIGLYYEYCDKCGKRYDPFEVAEAFNGNHDERYTDLDYFIFFDDLYCEDCAEEEFEKWEELQDEYEGHY